MNIVSACSSVKLNESKTYRKNFITPENTQTAATKLSQGNLTISELESQLMLNFMANKKAV